jgi:hypothetical protein
VWFAEVAEWGWAIAASAAISTLRFGAAVAVVGRRLASEVSPMLFALLAAATVGTCPYPGTDWMLLAPSKRDLPPEVLAAFGELAYGCTT